ncbi:hypothetical protein BPAE_0001g01010 [Botrytis paeoniae]|uniref:Uncharacterized protein n=1 Tax=Botrytis paeoniae TaxID=278948 RepID=A0A4Z1G2D9_9HELO|nr:hypothetical protein BPAE_0001g01010 [Botrytis paeoniae]
MAESIWIQSQGTLSLSKNTHAIPIDFGEVEESPSQPFPQDLGARKQKDIWTLGQILSTMAHSTCNSTERKVLGKVKIEVTTGYQHNSAYVSRTTTKVKPTRTITITSKSLFACYPDSMTVL